MPGTSAQASDSATVVAPDGIAIHTFDLMPASLVGIAEGRLPPGRYAVHRHATIEQYTYVVAGRLTATTGDHEHPGGRATELAAGDLILTLPGESLEFVNEGEELARVLYICAPPYPADDSDTQVLAGHEPASVAELRTAFERLQVVRGVVIAAIDRRLAALSADIQLSIGPT